MQYLSPFEIFLCRKEGLRFYPLQVDDGRVTRKDVEKVMEEIKGLKKTFE